MNLYDRIKDLANQHKISIRYLEEKLGYGNGTINRWKSTQPGVDKITKVADYFHVSTDYLLGRNEKNVDNSKHIDLKEEPKVLSYGGKPVSKEDMDIIKAILERHLNGGD